MKATSTNEPHRRIRKEGPDVEARPEVTPTISIDLMYLYEKGVKPTLVAVDHESGRVWNYALKDKSIKTVEVSEPPKKSIWTQNLLRTHVRKWRTRRPARRAVMRTRCNLHHRRPAGRGLR